MKLLELFSGTKSVSKAIGNKFDEIISVDINDKYKPTILIDILNWNYKIYTPNYFNVIWASPPCTEYSILKYGKGNVTEADKIVKKTLEIINYFNPSKWFIENPQTGRLKDRDFMQDLKYYDYDYCSFSDWGYKKRTRIWTNTEQSNELCKKNNCPNMIGNFHKCSFGGQGRQKNHIYKQVSGGDNAYRIPELLIKRLFNFSE